MDSFLTNYYNIMVMFPLIGVIFIGAVLFFVFKFYKKENTMEFKDKIKLIRKLIKLVIIIYIIFFVVSMIIILFVSNQLTLDYMGIFSALNEGGFTMVYLITLIPTIVEIILYVMIFKQYLILINNLEQEIIFNDVNISAVKNISKYMLWLVIFNLSFTIIAYLFNFIISYMIANGTIETLMSMLGDKYGALLLGNLNINTKVDLAILIKFIICVAINIVSVVYEKAYEIYLSDRLTI